MKILVRAGIASSLAIALSACNTLPRSGPAGGDISGEAAATITNSTKKAGFNYVLLDITKSILSFLNPSSFASLKADFGGDRGSIPASILGIGDIVQVTVFEAQAGGLFIPQDAGSRPGNYISLPNQTIDRNGMISIPYAGAVRAAGRTVREVQSEIERRLANRAIEPQVIITTVTSRSTSVSVLGDVNSPSQLDLSPAGEKVLDVISRAGGLSAPSVESYVTIERAGKKKTVLFKTIIDNPTENVYVRPGDTIYINRERRTFSVFGAANTTGRVNFEESNLTLSDALGQVGGLIDSRADPKEVYLYRMVDRKSVAEMGADLSKIKGDMVPVIFRANMRDPDMFFAMQKFAMQDKDIIYISNSASTEITKFLDILNGISNASANVPSNALSVRNSIRGFSQ